jgi:hypothetical protein
VIKTVLIALAFCMAINASAQQWNIFTVTGTILNPSPRNGIMFLDTTDKGGINFAGGADTGLIGPFVTVATSSTNFPTNVEYISRDNGLVMYEWGASVGGGVAGHDYGGDYTAYTVDVSGTVPSNLTLASGHGQDPQVHMFDTDAAVAEPVDTATGYLWYANDLLKENGAVPLTYGINAKFGGLTGADFGSTYDVTFQLVGILTPGTPCLTVSEAGRGVHHYYKALGDNYDCIELGALHNWIARAVGSLPSPTA